MKTAVIILAVVSAMIFVDSENISFDDIQWCALEAVAFLEVLIISRDQ
jgi:hypothetical protein